MTIGAVWAVAPGTFRPSTRTIETGAGTTIPLAGTQGTDWPVAEPYGIAVDQAGNTYFSSSCQVFMRRPDGTIAVAAGDGRCGFSGDGGPASQARLSSPKCLAVDVASNLFIFGCAADIPS